MSSNNTDKSVPFDLLSNRDKQKICYELQQHGIAFTLTRDPENLAIKSKDFEAAAAIIREVLAGGIISKTDKGTSRAFAFAAPPPDLPPGMASKRHFMKSLKDKIGMAGRSWEPGQALSIGEAHDKFMVFLGWCPRCDGLIENPANWDGKAHCCIQCAQQGDERFAARLVELIESGNKKEG